LKNSFLEDKRTIRLKLEETRGYIKNNKYPNGIDDEDFDRSPLTGWETKKKKDKSSSYKEPE
jgi:hypothetical protein